MKFLRFGFVLFAFAAWTVFAAQAAIPESDYWALVQESRDVLARLENATAEETRQQLEQLAGRWEAITEVQVDGQNVPVHHQYLVNMLRDESPDLEAIDNLLASLLTTQQAQPTQAVPVADSDSLHSILARPEYQWAEPAPNPIQEWIQKLWDAFFRLLNELLGDTITVDGNLVTGVMAVLLMIVFVYVFRTLFADFSRDAKLNQNEGEDVPLTSEAAFAKAQQLSRGGDYRSAVRYLYLSALLIMDERSVLRYDRSKTNREYLRSVENSPELAQPLSEVIEVFDNVWYGYHELGEDTFKHYSDRVEELKEKKV